MKALAALLTSAWVTMNMVSTYQNAYNSQSHLRNETERPVVLWKPAAPISTAVNLINNDSISPTIQHCVETIALENLNVQNETYRF